MPRHYRDRTKHQNGASITSGSLSLTAGALLQGQGLSGSSFPYTVAVYAQDTSGNLTSYEEMDVTGGTYPTLTVTRGINSTTAVAHDTTHIIAQVVGTNDLNNFDQITGGLVFNVTTYGATGDGTTDDTTAVQAAITAAAVSGGTVFFPPGTYLCSSALSFPHTGSFPSPEPPLRLLGVGPGWRPGTPPDGGSMLDLRSAGSGAAMLDFRASGLVIIDGLSLVNNGSSTAPLIQSTNTTLHIHECGFFGNPAHSGSGCVQDAIVLGGAAGSATNGMAATSPFSGYGTVIQNNFFQNIRHAVLVQTSGNAVIIRDNTIWTLCGGDAAILVTPSWFVNSGLVIDGNLFEMPGYTYGIQLVNVINSTLSANGFYDVAGSAAVAGIRFGTGTSGNVVAGGNVDDGSIPLASDGTGLNTVLGSGTSVATTSVLGTVKVDNNSAGSPIAITQAGYLASITALTNANIAAGAAIVPTKLASGEYTGTDFKVTGLTGATSASRYAGATSGGAPVSGTFVTGDMVLDIVNARVYICTAGGTPGTWVNASGGMTNPMTTANDLILGGTAGAPTRLASIAGKFLQTDGSGVVSWGSAPAPGSATLAGDSDVSISSPAAGQLLKYDGAHWINAGDAAFTAPTFTNSWVNFGGSVAAVGYLKDASGFVHLRGAVKSGSSLTAAIFTLPVGYRPSGQVALLTQGSVGILEVDITTAGVVAVAAQIVGSNATSYVGLESLTFSTL